MPASYPGATYSPRTKENKAGVVYDEAKKTIGYVEDVTKLDDEVVAVETELGTNPKGAKADVKTRLDDVDSAISAKMTNPMTTAEDLVKGGASGTPGRLAKGAEGKVLGILSSVLAWVDRMINPMTTAGDIIKGGASGAPERLAIGSDGQRLTLASGVPAWVDDKAAITFIIDGGGSAITTGEKGHLSIPFACTIESVILLADQSGSIVVDIWKDAYANFPPTDADTITSATPPTITTAVKSEDTTLTNWTKTIAAGDILAFNVDSITTVERVTLILKVKKT